MRRTRWTARVGLLSLAGLAAAPLTAVPASAAITPYISEFHYDNASTDSGEAIEIGADPNADLTGWTVVLYNGGSTPVGLAYDTDAVPNANAAGFSVINYPSNGIQNGSPDGIALVDPGGVVTQFLSYEGIFTASDGPAAGMASTDVGVVEAGADAVGLSLQLVDGAWTGPSTATFGASNGGVVDPPDEGDCDETPTHSISQVQGSGDATPLAGQAVIVRGTVVADHQEGGYDGFFIQDAGDGNPATSDGVFVYDPAGPAVALGDVVQVSGTPTEFNGLTQVATVTEVGVCSTGNPAPAAASLDLPATSAALEPLEGMLVVPADTLTVTEVFNLNRFGEVVLSEGGRLVVPTETVEPGAPAQAVMASNAARRIVLDDGRTTNLATAGIAPPYLTLDDPVRVGDELGTLQPSVLSFGFSAWRLQPADGTADGNTFVERNPRTPAPEAVGGDIQVGAFNVLNFFITYGGISRGAPNEAEMLQQRAKIVTAITAMDAEVLALQEIENSAVTTPATPYAALQNLVGALNEAEGGNVWGYVEASEASDVITNAIIYRTDAVTPVGPPRKITEDPVWDNAREPIAQTFTAGGDAFTVIGNHLKSKGSGSGPGNVDIGDGQGASNADRVAQAQSLMAFVDEVVAAVGDPDVLLLGDFNAYAKEDPIDVIHAAGFVDLGETLNPGDYSYVFNGESGSLDHAFASPSQFAKVSGVDTWNINAVESIAYQYDGHDSLYSTYAYAASDHSPEILGMLLRTPEQMCDGRPATIFGTAGKETITGTAGADVIVGLGGNDTIFGLAGNDTICGGVGGDTLRGGGGDDRLFGEAGNDKLFGEAGADFLDGGSGSNKLVQ